MPAYMSVERLGPRYGSGRAVAAGSATARCLVAGGVPHVLASACARNTPTQDPPLAQPASLETGGVVLVALACSTRRRAPICSSSLGRDPRHQGLTRPPQLHARGWSDIEPRAEREQGRLLYCACGLARTLMLLGPVLWASVPGRASPWGARATLGCRSRRRSRTRRLMPFLVASRRRLSWRSGFARAPLETPCGRRSWRPSAAAQPPLSRFLGAARAPLVGTSRVGTSTKAEGTAHQTRRDRSFSSQPPAPGMCSSLAVCR